MSASRGALSTCRRGIPEEIVIPAKAGISRFVVLLVGTSDEALGPGFRRDNEIMRRRYF